MDREALHVRKADYAYAIGPAPASESYLNIDKILDVAKRSQAPRRSILAMGFSQKTQALREPALTRASNLSGPRPHSMEMMGSKTSARQQMEKAGVPFCPGHGARAGLCRRG